MYHVVMAKMDAYGLLTDFGGKATGAFLISFTWIEGVIGKP